MTTSTPTLLQPQGFLADDLAWRYTLVTSIDMSVIGEMRNATSRTLSLELDAAGSAMCVLSIDDDLAGEAVPWRTAIIAERGNDAMWSGPITNRTPDTDQGSVTLSAVGWFEKVIGYTLRQNFPKTDRDAGLFAFDLLAEANSYYPTRITSGTAETTQMRTQTIAQDYSIGQAIQDLSQLEDGFDFLVDPLTREMNIYALLGQDRPEVRWIFVPGGPNNIKGPVIPEDGTQLYNDITVRGGAGSVNVDASSSKSYYDLYRSQVLSLSDVKDASIVAAYANAELVYKSDPRVSYQFAPNPEGDRGVPVFGRDFGLGDTTYLTARRGYVDVRDQSQRCFGVDLSIADSGQASITNMKTILT